MKPTETSSANCEIRVAGSLSPQWIDWFDGLVINTENGETLLRGPVADQAALFGLLKKIRDSGLPLISVRHITTQEIKMNPKYTSLSEMPAKLSTLWIFLLFNMVFADIFTFMHPGFMAQIVAGTPIDGIVITPIFLLIAAIVTEISIAMVFLSRFLKPGINRWANIVGAVITILWVVGGGSLIATYIFFASIEVLTSLVIIGMAWNWRNVEA